MRRLRLVFTVGMLSIVAAACKPGLTIINPTDEATVSGVVPVGIQATPDAKSGLDAVDANVDGTNIPLNETHDGTIDTETLTNGRHTVTANASNADGTTTKSVTINVENPPRPGTVCLGGDSITFQSFYPWGQTDQAPENLSAISGLGWRVQEIMGWAQEQAAQRDCQTFISALGVNDTNPVHNGGFTVEDQDRFTALWNTPHAQACKVQVLPYWGSGLGQITEEENMYDPVVRLAQELAHIDAMTAFREWALQQDALREDLVTIDWMPYVTAYPEVMDVDGIHLAWADYPREDGAVWHTTLLEAAEIRQNFYWADASAACQGFIQAFETAPEELTTDPEQFALPS